MKKILLIIFTLFTLSAISQPNGKKASLKGTIYSIERKSGQDVISETFYFKSDNVYELKGNTYYSKDNSYSYYTHTGKYDINHPEIIFILEVITNEDDGTSTRPNSKKTGKIANGNKEIIIDNFKYIRQ